MAQKVIAVIGATGAQGGGLVTAILKDGAFAVRALTRDPSKPGALALKEKGAEVVAFDMDKPETFDAALKGAYGVYVVTNFWEHFSAAKELQQCKDVAAACEKAGVEHIVYSTLEDTRPFFSKQTEDVPPKLHGGDMYVPHFDAKGEANAVFPAAKTTFFHTSFYLENFWKFGMVKDGTFACPMGDVAFPVIAEADIGACAYGVFKAGDKYKGKSVYAAGDCLPVADIMAAVSKATGKEFKYVPVTRDAYAGFGFPGADDLANMFDFNKKSADFAKNRDLALSKELNPGILSVPAWAEANKEALVKLA